MLAATLTMSMFGCGSGAANTAESSAKADAAIKFAKGETNQYYIGCDYVKVTSENAQSLLKKFGQVMWRNI